MIPTSDQLPHAATACRVIEILLTRPGLSPATREWLEFELYELRLDIADTEFLPDPTDLRSLARYFDLPLPDPDPVRRREIDYDW